MGKVTAVFGDHDEKTIAQLEDVASRAEQAALMADGHVGYVMPIGGVAAYENKASVVGVGFDIACGNAAIRTNLTLDSLHSKARNQLGTVGSGNRYVDVFADETGTIWVGVHFGSRGLGHTIASGFLALSQNKKWSERAREVEALLDLSSPLGDAYWGAMELAGKYAYAGREWVARSVVDILGGREMELVHKHHNFAWKEMHDGRELVVVRKGATPAFPGQKGSLADPWVTTR